MFRCRWPGRCLLCLCLQRLTGGLSEWGLWQGKIELLQPNGLCPLAQSSAATVTKVSPSKNINVGFILYIQLGFQQSYPFLQPIDVSSRVRFTFWIWTLERAALLLGHICLWFRRIVDTRDLMECTALARRPLPITPTLPCTTLVTCNYHKSQDEQEARQRGKGRRAPAGDQGAL